MVDNLQYCFVLVFPKHLDCLVVVLNVISKELCFYVNCSVLLVETYGLRFTVNGIFVLSFLRTTTTYGLSSESFLRLPVITYTFSVSFSRNVASLTMNALTSQSYLLFIGIQIVFGIFMFLTMQIRKADSPEKSGSLD